MTVDWHILSFKHNVEHKNYFRLLSPDLRNQSLVLRIPTVSGFPVNNLINYFWILEPPG